MSQLEMAMERMYGDVGLTDELIDEEAEVLLAWGAAEHERMAAQGLDDEAFDARAKQIRRAMSRMNNFIGKRGKYDEEKARTVLARFTEGAYELGYSIPAHQVNQFISVQTDLDNMTTLQALLAMVSPPPATDQTDQTIGAEQNGEEE